MKKYAKQFLIFAALVLFLSGFNGVKPAKAAGAADGLTYSIYTEVSMVSVVSNSNSPVYYQVVKEATPSSLKAAAWLPAADNTHEVSSGAALTTVYERLIDITALTKTSYIAVTTDPEATAAADCKIIEIKFAVKDVKYTLDYSVEDAPNAYSIFKTFLVNGVDGSKLADYDKCSNEEAKSFANLRKSLVIYWRRNSDCNWAYDTSSSLSAKTNITSGYTSFTAAYNMLRSSGGALYVKVHGTDHIDSPYYDKIVMPSKEVKIKLSKTAAAPTIKIDYSKASLAIKNGMEIQFDAGTGTVYVPAYDKNEKDNTDRLSLSSAVTSAKVSCIYIHEIVNFIDEKFGSGSIPYDPGDKVELKVRTSASEKKYASRWASISFYAPILAPLASDENRSTPVGKYVYDAFNSTLTLTFDIKNVEGRVLEYAIGAEVGCDQSTLKYTSVEDPTKPIDLSKYVGKTFKYKDSTGTTKNVKYEDAVVFYRWAAIVSKEDKTDPEKNKVFSYSYEAISVSYPTYYNVTVGKGEATNGSFVLKSADGKKDLATTAIEVSKGSTLSFQVVPTPASGYVVDKVTYTIGGVSKEVSLSNKKYLCSIENVTAATTVTVNVTFKEK